MFVQIAITQSMLLKAIDYQLQMFKLKLIRTLANFILQQYILGKVHQIIVSPRRSVNCTCGRAQQPAHTTSHCQGRRPTEDDPRLKVTPGGGQTPARPPPLSTHRPALVCAMHLGNFDLRWSPL